MRLRTKVKTRIELLVCLAVTAFFACYSGVLAADDPPRTGQLAVNPPRPPVLVPPILDTATPANTIIRIDLTTQRLQLLVGGETAIDTPISSGRKDLETPTGKFEVSQKEPRKKQDTYGNLVNASGAVVVAGVYRLLDPVPSGLRFEPIELDHVIFIKGQTFVIHSGAVGGLPVSDSSIIVPTEIGKALFGQVAEGCPIEIIGEQPA